MHRPRGASAGLGRGSALLDLVLDFDSEQLHIDPVVLEARWLFALTLTLTLIANSIAQDSFCSQRVMFEGGLELLSHKVFANLVVCGCFTGIGFMVDPGAIQVLLLAPLSGKESHKRMVLFSLIGLFLVFPALALAATHLFHLKGALAVAALLICVMPGGPNSVILSTITGGRPEINAVATTASSCLGIILVPMLCTEVVSRGMHGLDLHIDRPGLILSCTEVTICMAAGLWLRSRCGGGVDDIAKQVSPPGLALYWLMMTCVAFPCLTFARWLAGMGIFASGLLVGGALGWIAGANSSQMISMSLELAFHDMPLAYAIAANSFQGSKALQVDVLDSMIVIAWSYTTCGNLIALGYRCVKGSWASSKGCEDAEYKESASIYGAA